MSSTSTSPQTDGTPHSTSPGWKPNTDARPLLDFVKELIMDVARTHPCWTQDHTARVLAQVAAGSCGSRRAA